MNHLQRLALPVATASLIVFMSWPVQAREDPPPESNVVDIRGIWKDTKLDKKGAAARGLNASEIQTPRKVKNVPPNYPEELKHVRIQGTVHLECTIDTAGVPTDCRVTRGPHPRLDEEALRCVKDWRFKPLTVRGQPAPTLVEFTVSFRLS